MMRSQLHILYVSTRMPSHLLTGDRIRAYHLIKGLIERGYTVTLLAFDNLTHLRYESDIHSLCHEIIPIHRNDVEFQEHSRSRQLADTVSGAFHGYPRRVWQFHSLDLQKAFYEVLASHTFDVIHFSEIGVSELVDLVIPDRREAKVYDLIDAVSLSVRNSLKFRFDATWPIRLIESYQLLWYERKLLDKVDAASVVSDRDRSYLGDHERLYVIGIGLDIPELDYSVKKEYDLLFVGDMSMRANIDAILWFKKSIWPILQAKRPKTTFYIVGRDPDPRIQSLASEYITVTGKVDDVGWYHKRAKVFVAPIRYGSGQKIKLLEACAQGLPVVTTHEANQGVNAPDGKAILLMDKPEDMAEAILKLLANEQMRRSIGEKAHQFIMDHYSWERSTDLLLDMYSHAIEHAHSHPQSQI